MKPSKPILQSFAPLIEPSAKTLVLGSMPGQASLDASQYYAHPRNFFWQFAAEALGIEVPKDYAQRLALLTHFQVAVWDVLQHCERVGSLDAKIITASEQPNDIIGLLRQHPHIDTICFNGQKAFQVFKRHLLNQHSDFFVAYTLKVLPSTSPANASIARTTKCAQWQEWVWRLDIAGANHSIAP